MARNGTVATSQALATQIGLDMLRIGGTAVDAAFAADAALGLMEPMSCGISGDGYGEVIHDLLLLPHCAPAKMKKTRSAKLTAVVMLMGDGIWPGYSD
jgi:gamma-glutamyltranspeptidase